MLRDGKTHVVITLHEVSAVPDGGRFVAHSPRVPLPPDGNGANRRRKQAGLEPVPDFGLRLRQRPIRPFEDFAPGEGEAGLNGQIRQVGSGSVSAAR
jgi:hypothetical protein